jgi:hypothetical protein
VLIAGSEAGQSQYESYGTRRCGGDCHETGGIVRGTDLLILDRAGLLK